MDESDLEEMGFSRDESLLKVTKKLICHGVRATP